MSDQLLVGTMILDIVEQYLLYLRFFLGFNPFMLILCKFHGFGADGIRVTEWVMIEYNDGPFSRLILFLQQLNYKKM